MIASPPLSRPQALFDFAGSGTIDPRLTFTRASTATRTNKFGYIETVPSGIPRIDYNPITGAIRGVLIEPQATNLLKWSSDQTNAVWKKIDSSVESSSVMSPTGAAFKKLNESASSGTHEIAQPAAMTIGATYTLSIIALASECSEIRIAGWIFASWLVFPEASFNLMTGTASGSNARIEDFGGGVFRCSVTGVASGINGGMVVGLKKQGSRSYTGDGVSGAYIIAAQMEESSRASSFIETTTSQVTRAADSLSIQGAVFNRFFAQSEGAIYVEFEHNRAAWPSSSPVVMCISGGTGTGEASGIVLSASAAGTSLDVSSSSVSQASLLVSSGSAAGVHRAAFSYKADGFSLSTDNATPATDTTGTIPTLSRLDIGSVIGARHFSGWIKRIAIFPRAASSATIQSITQ